MTLQRGDISGILEQEYSLITKSNEFLAKASDLFFTFRSNLWLLARFETCRVLWPDVTQTAMIS